MEERRTGDHAVPDIRVEPGGYGGAEHGWWYAWIEEPDRLGIYVEAHGFERAIDELEREIVREVQRLEPADGPSDLPPALETLYVVWKDGALSTYLREHVRLDWEPAYSTAWQTGAPR